MGELTPSIHLRTPLNTLASFHYFRRFDFEQVDGRQEIIADSGAYSAMSTGAAVDIDEYAEWLQRWWPQFIWAAGLDVIGDADGTWRNFRILRDRYDLDVVPTIHFGADPSLLDRFVDEGIDFVGLGGMVMSADKRRILAWVAAMFRYARDHHPQVRFHGWAATRRYLADRFPFYSIDSSSWAKAMRYGVLDVWDPRTGKRIPIKLDGRQMFRHGRLVRTVYGCDPSLISRSDSTNRQTQIAMSIRSWQMFDEWLADRFAVTAPTYAISSTDRGTRMHMALFPDQCKVLCDTVDHDGRYVMPQPATIES